MNCYIIAAHNCNGIDVYKLIFAHSDEELGQYIKDNVRELMEIFEEFQYFDKCENTIASKLVKLLEARNEYFEYWDQDELIKEIEKILNEYTNEDIFTHFGGHCISSNSVYARGISISIIYHKDIIYANINQI